MKCKYCGGRTFRLIVKYIQNRKYDEKGNVDYTDLEDFLGDEKNSHFCVGCHRDLKDKELIKR